MESKIIYGALQKVAEDHCVSIEEVIEEISTCIDVAMKTAEKEDNQEVMAIWKEIPCANNKPTPVELLAYLAKRIQEDR